MKKQFLLGVCAVLLSGSAIFAAGITGLPVDKAEFSKLHKSGYAIQIANSFDIAYYTDNHEYTIGVGGFTFDNHVNGSGSTNGLSPEIFVRKNYALTSSSVVGFGAAVGTRIGQIDSVNIENALHLKSYVFFEYAANPNVLLGASVALFDHNTYSWGGATPGATNTTTYLGGSSVQIAFLF